MNAGFQAGFNCNAAVRLNADSHDNHIRIDVDTFPVNDQPFFTRLDTKNPDTGIEPHPIGFQLLPNNLRQLRFHPRQQFRPGLDHADMDLALAKCFAHLQGDISHADYHRSFHTGAPDEVFDPPSVFKMFQHHDSRQIQTWNIRDNRGCARCNQHLIIGNGKWVSFQSPAADRFCRSIDMGCMMARQYRNPLLAEGISLPYDQILHRAGRIGDIVRHATGAE